MKLFFNSALLLLGLFRRSGGEANGERVGTPGPFKGL